MVAEKERERSCTARVSNVPLTAEARDLFDFFDSAVGPGSVFACEIFTERSDWKSRGYARVQFDSLPALRRALHSAALHFCGSRLSLCPSFDDILVRPVLPSHRLRRGALHLGSLAGEAGPLLVTESWPLARAEVMPERERIVFWVSADSTDEIFKLEFQFRDLVRVLGCGFGGTNSNAVLLQVKYAPKIYYKMSGTTVDSKFRGDRYRICREDLKLVWVRTTDFSKLKSIGQSSCFCWEIDNGLTNSEILAAFPNHEELEHLKERHEQLNFPASELVPIINPPSGLGLEYEILFQLNSLVHAQKISLSSANEKLFLYLRGLPVETANAVLSKLQKTKSTCYEPLKFIQKHLISMKKPKGLPLAQKSTTLEKNLMNCYRVLVTPSKVFFLGPELETSNYIVRHYAAYASDFIRVSFVEEDWTKLPSDSVSTQIESGLFSRPHRTKIYDRILTILRDGIVIGTKRFEFLAFSASQLRSNSVWMFASNDSVSAESIRQWMGSFNKIRSVSKCAARMGQLFSSSKQTFNVPAQDVQTIPDIEVVTDAIKYCFSDGIGKISLSFARQVAQKCGLDHVPSAFQIRYGGYKGVIAVDRTSFRKLSLRRSMLKFESKNTMLCVTKWTESMPCYLNREIICLLSTLGIADENFLAIHEEQMRLLDGMLTNRNIALNVLEGIPGGSTKAGLTEMLLHGYEPNEEPYLSMLLKAFHEYQLSEIRNKCRIFVPKGRVLLGCLDERGILDYGQVYIRLSLTKSELEGMDQTFFQRTDDKTSVVIGKVLVTKNPCLHPGDIRVLQAVYEPELEDAGLIDCVVFPQKGERPHPNECSGGDLDGDQYFVCWDENLIPVNTDKPTDYIGQRPRIMDHDVTLEEVQRFFVDYLINDTLGTISTAHLVHADREPSKARSHKCLQLANLHSMAVDFAKTGAPAEMPRVLKPREYPDFLRRDDRPMYISTGVLGKLYRGTKKQEDEESPDLVWSETVAQAAYDDDLVVSGFESFLVAAEEYKNLYAKKLSSLMKYYGAQCEDELLLGNLRMRSAYLERDNRKYSEMKDRILVAVRALQAEAKGWFRTGCQKHEFSKMASAWYHVTYHPDYCSGTKFLSFPWVLTDILLNIKSSRKQERLRRKSCLDPPMET